MNLIPTHRGFIIDVSRKSDSLAAATGAGSAAGGGGVSPQLFNEMRDSMAQVKATVTGVAQRYVLLIIIIFSARAARQDKLNMRFTNIY